MRKLFFKKKLDYEKRMKELDQIAEEQQLRQRVRDRERELGLRHTRKKPAWGKAMMAVVYGLCIEIVVKYEPIEYGKGYDIVHNPDQFKLTIDGKTYE